MYFYAKYMWDESCTCTLSTCGMSHVLEYNVCAYVISYGTQRRVVAF